MRINSIQLHNTNIQNNTLKNTVQTKQYIYNSNFCNIPLSFGSDLIINKRSTYEQSTEDKLGEISDKYKLYDFGDVVPLTMAEQILEEDRKLISKHFFEDDDISKFGYVLNLYKQKDNDKYTTLLKKLNNCNIRTAIKNYEGFYSSTIYPIKDFIDDSNLEYSTLWIKEKTVGQQNLADYWLKILKSDTDVKTLTLREKREIINENLKNTKKQKLLIDSTIDLWLSSFLDKNTDAIKPENKGNEDDFTIIKQRIHNLKNSDKQKFAAFVNSTDFDKLKIDDTFVIDLMLTAIQNEDENYIDNSMKFKKEYILSMADFDDERNRMISAVLKKSIREEQKRIAFQDILSSTANIDTKNLDENLVKQIFKLYGRTKSEEILNDLSNQKEYFNQVFSRLIVKNPINADEFYEDHNTNKYNFIFSLVKSRTNNTDGNVAIKNINNLREFIETYNRIKNNSELLTDFDKCNNCWNNIINEARKEWEENHLTQIINNNLNAYIEIAKIQTSKEFSYIQDETLTALKEILKSNEYTPVQKVFLLKKSISGEGYDFRRFVVQDKPNMYLRKKFIDALIDAEKNDETEFKEFQQNFIDSVRYNDIENIMNLKVGNVDFANFCQKQLGIFAPSLESLQLELDKLTDDELRLLTEKFKKNFIEIKHNDDFICETNKYDFAVQLDGKFEESIGSLKIYIDNQQISIRDYMTDKFDEVNTKITEMHYDVIDNTKITEKVLNSIIDLKASAQENLKRIAKIEAALTIMEKRFPQRAKEIKQAKTWLQKVKRSLKQTCTPKGLLKKGLAIAGASLAVAGSIAIMPESTPAVVAWAVKIVAGTIGGVSGSNLV